MSGVASVEAHCPCRFLRSKSEQPESDITLSGNATFLTQYAKRGFTLSA